MPERRQRQFANCPSAPQNRFVAHQYVTPIGCWLPYELRPRPAGDQYGDRFAVRLCLIEGTLHFLTRRGNPLAASCAAADEIRQRFCDAESCRASNVRR